MKATTALLLLILMTATAAAQEIDAATASADNLQDSLETSGTVGEGGGGGGWDLEGTKKGVTTGASPSALQENVEASAIAGGSGTGGGWDLEGTKKGAVPRSVNTEEDGMVPGRVYVRSNPDRGIVHLEVFDESGEVVRSATYSDDSVFSDENEFRALAAQLEDNSDPLVQQAISELGQAGNGNIRKLGENKLPFGNRFANFFTFGLWNRLHNKGEINNIRGGEEQEDEQPGIFSRITNWIFARDSAHQTPETTQSMQAKSGIMKNEQDTLKGIVNNVRGGEEEDAGEETEQDPENETSQETGDMQQENRDATLLSNVQKVKSEGTGKNALDNNTR